ncbi:hypothetical protein NDU88_004759 [Pleurodeles waltl]|uniref:Uncharacterized protein n=1 Tax=Pleurodeles waltl TaxID=8319 RepID=A0AAV7RJ53_PLEWA|nr:hypothetical protein NDU88_004759 [Pleurodeles waltl]
MPVATRALSRRSCGQPRPRPRLLFDCCPTSQKPLFPTSDPCCGSTFEYQQVEESRGCSASTTARSTSPHSSRVGDSWPEKSALRFTP